MRHLIVEGVDGSGKTTLVTTLADELKLPIHPRSTPSVGGPPPDLDAWVEREFARVKESGIYDRHALVSEPIYGPIIRGRVPGKFNDPVWLASSRERLAQESMLILCLPPWHVVYKNLSNDQTPQMDGVSRHAAEIYRAYTMVRPKWPGLVVPYDYTTGNIDRLVSVAKLIKERDF